MRRRSTNLGSPHDLHFRQMRAARSALAVRSGSPRKDLRPAPRDSGGRRGRRSENNYTEVSSAFQGRARSSDLLSKKGRRNPRGGRGGRSASRLGNEPPARGKHAPISAHSFEASVRRISASGLTGLN